MHANSNREWTRIDAKQKQTADGSDAASLWRDRLQIYADKDRKIRTGGSAVFWPKQRYDRRMRAVSGTRFGPAGASPYQVSVAIYIERNQSALVRLSLEGIA
jgi:hypothetical protein